MPKETPKGFMEYVEKLREEKETLRDETTKKIITNLVDNLQNVKLSKALVWDKLEPLQGEITKEIDSEDFKEVDGIFRGVSIKISNYFDRVKDFLLLTTAEINTVSECMIELFGIINELHSEKEGKILEKEIPETETEVEEEEELSVTPPNILYECLECNRKFTEVSFSGCKNCGGHDFQTEYIKK